MSLEHMCANCGRTFVRFNSLQRKCHLCTYNKLSPKKPMKRIGKVTQAWINDRQQWIQNHEPINGYWNCHYCNKQITIDDLTLDHYHSRSRRPDLRRDQSNLVPCCWSCNEEKGSKSGDEFKGA